MRDKTDDNSVETIQTFYDQYDDIQRLSKNVVPFPIAMSEQGLSIIDDVEHLLMRRDYRDMIEERLLCALQDIAKDIIKKNGE